MSNWGFQVSNSAGHVVASSTDRVLAATALVHLIPWDTKPAHYFWTAYDYIPSYPGEMPEPNKESWTSYYNYPLYYYNIPTDIPKDETFFGFNAPVGHSIFMDRIYSSTVGHISSTYNNLQMVIARPILAADNASDTYGMVVYDAVGNICYHSGSKVLKVLKRIDGSGTFNTGGHTPFFFYNGNSFYKYVSSTAYHPQGCGIRIDSATTYTRRVRGTSSDAYAGPNTMPDPLSQGFIAAVDTTLF